MLKHLLQLGASLAALKHAENTGLKNRPWSGFTASFLGGACVDGGMGRVCLPKSVGVGRHALRGQKCMQSGSGAEVQLIHT